MRKKDLHWYAMISDFNKKGITKIDVLGSELIESILKKIRSKKITSYDELKEYVRVSLMSRYWSRAEYEVIVSDLFDIENGVKIDVYYQLEMNLDRIIEYIIRELKIEF